MLAFVGSWSAPMTLEWSERDPSTKPHRHQPQSGGL